MCLFYSKIYHMNSKRTFTTVLATLVWFTVQMWLLLHHWVLTRTLHKYFLITVFKQCGCQPSHSLYPPPPHCTGAVCRAGPGRVRGAGDRRTHQTDGHQRGHRGPQHGVHTGVLRRQERADHRSHRLHGKSAGGEAAEGVPWGQSPVPAGQTQGRTVHGAEGQRHDDLQGKSSVCTVKSWYVYIWRIPLLPNRSPAICWTFTDNTFKPYMNATIEYIST